MLIIVVVSQKGGAGKTPTAVHLAFALSLAGYFVLFVDADPQATASLHFIGTGYREQSPTLYEALIHMRAIQPLVISDRLHLLPAHDGLSRAEIELEKEAGKAGRGASIYQYRLQRLLRKYQGYQIMIIDTPGSTASIFPTLALTAGNLAVVPVKTEFAAERANVDTMNLIDDIIGDEENPGLNPNLLVWGLLATQYESNVRHHQGVLDALKDQYGELVYAEPSRKTNRYNDATALRCDIRELAPELGGYWDRVAANVLKKVGTLS